jgi:hypothetical protein
MNTRKLILNLGTIAVTAMAFLAFRPAKFTPGVWTKTTGTLRQTTCVQTNQGVGLCQTGITYYTQGGTSLGQSIVYQSVQ